MKFILYLFLGLITTVVMTLTMGYRYVSNATSGGYETLDNKTYYVGEMKGLGDRNSTILRNVDLATFEVLKNGYARDANRAYFKGKVIFKVHALSFKPLQYHFSKDRDRVYYQEKIISQLPENFKVLNRDYGCDQLYAYYKGEIVKESRGTRFRLLRYGYAKDHQYVYFNGEIISDDPVNFEIVKYENGDAFAKDNQNVYLDGEAIEDKDPNTFNG